MRFARLRFRTVALASLVSLALIPMTSTPSAAQSLPASDVAYRLPPDAIRTALDAPPLPGVSLDPTRRRMLLMDRITLPPISDLAQPMLRLAGDRFNPRTNGPFAPRRITGFALRSVDAQGSDKDLRRVELPADGSFSAPSWSPDGSRFIFTRTTTDTIELWIGDATTTKARKLAEGLNAASGGSARWMPDGKRLLVRFVPSGRGPMPTPPPAPSGPVIQETRGIRAQIRTYQDLLQNQHDERVFDWLMESQLAYIDLERGDRSDIGAPAIFGTLDPSADGRWLLISRTERPYSYLVPAGLFPETVELWDAATGSVVRQLTKMPLREDIPIQGVQKGPRGHEWRETADATLMWVEALDEGDPRNKVPHRDRIVTLSPPFEGDGTEWFRTEHRFSGMIWLEPGAKLADGGDAGNLAMVSEYDRDRRWTRTWMYDAVKPQASPRLVFDRSVNDRYGNPGSPLTTRLPNGYSVAQVRDGAVFLSGVGATPDGDRPFLDRMSLDTLKPERLWRNEGECFESVIDIIAPAGAGGKAGIRVLTSYETPKDPPNYFIRDLASGDRTAVTAFKDPAPELRRVRKELIRYKRSDGVDLSATMYLPDGYITGTKLPLLIWAYPLEFNDASTAGQVSGSTRRFTGIGGISHLFLLTQGYAVMDDATMPVVGDPETVNDTFVEQIKASARAAIDKAVEMGVSDGLRVAVGGHSYGAFMTANLLAHTDYFKAGLARSGAYNRTLTPFGFQGERRTYWEAVDTYTKMSPFTHADKIKAPLLMIHGQIDSNPGTFPVQSERLYAAIKGNGGIARLVMLPFEDHGYAARESVMHTHAEMVEWLDRYVKNVPTGSEASGNAKSGG